MNENPNMFRLYELKKGLLSALKLRDSIHAGPKIGDEKGYLLAHEVKIPSFLDKCFATVLFLQSITYKKLCN